MYEQFSQFQLTTMSNFENHQRRDLASKASPTDATSQKVQSNIIVTRRKPLTRLAEWLCEIKIISSVDRWPKHYQSHGVSLEDMSSAARR